MGNNSTIHMQNYIKEIFEIVINLYKETAPELISEALKIDITNIDKLNVQDVTKKLNNLEINYKVTNEKEKEQIWYDDSIKQKIMAEFINKKINIKPDELRIYLNEPEVIEKNSVEEIKQIRDKTGMSKIISDINYISHEIAHAFENIIKVENPSYIDSEIYLLKNNTNMIDYDLGESFAISMERIILDKLKEDNKLKQYGLEEYATIADIEDVWNKKRINAFAKKGTLEKTSMGKEITYLDLEMLPYLFIKKNGIEETVKNIKKLDLFKIYNCIPNKNDNNGINEFYNKLFEEEYSEFFITEDYKKIYSDEEIIKLIKQIELKEKIKIAEKLDTEILERKKELEEKINEKERKKNYE